MTMTRCTATEPDGSPCPWGAAGGLTVCAKHLGEAAQIELERRREHRQRMEDFKRENRRILEILQPLAAVAERQIEEQRAAAKQARKDAWHAHRREQDAERRERAAETRKAAQEAAQDPDTRQVCRECGRRLPLEAFHRDRRAPLGRKDQCRDCKAGHDRARREAKR